MRSTQKACGILPWTSAEVALFVVRHWLGVRFEGDVASIRPALYPGSPPVRADLRFRGGRLRIDLDGSGKTVESFVDGKRVNPAADDSIRLPADYPGGAVIIRTRR